MTNSLDSIPCPLHAAAFASPEAPAIVGLSGTLTFRDLDRRVSSAAGRVAGSGFGIGARVALYLPKDERYIVLLLALIRVGAVACPVSSRLPPAGVVPLLGKAACSALISENEEIFRAIGGSVQGLRPETLLGDGADRTEPLEPLDIPLSQPATVVFTSGSTGTPKAVLHTYANHHYSAVGSAANIPLGLDDRWLHSLPLYHVGGLSIVFRCLLAGAAMVLPEPDAPLGQAIAECGATHVSVVATQLRRLLCEESVPAPETLKAVLLGGGPVTGALVEEAVSRSLPVYTSYGLTEMASQVTTTPPGASVELLRTSGQVLPHREISVSGEGEILVRGDTLFAGYVEDGTVNRPLDAEGWFHTGDLGVLDEDGSLRVRGREDNLFVSGGENVQPEEIEEALRRLEGVEDAVVVPVPDREFGERPVAFVGLTEDALEPEDLVDALERALPRFKIPVRFYAWPADAGRAGIKVDRASFRELALRRASGDEPGTREEA